MGDHNGFQLHIWIVDLGCWEGGLHLRSSMKDVGPPKADLLPWDNIECLLEFVLGYSNNMRRRGSVGIICGV